jgi:hypothetical protein
MMKNDDRDAQRRIDRSEEDPVATDALRGAKKIAAFMGVPEGKAYYNLETGVWPAGKDGDRIWIASKAVLRGYYERITNPLIPSSPQPQPVVTEPNGLAPPRRGRPRKNAR